MARFTAVSQCSKQAVGRTVKSLRRADSGKYRNLWETYYINAQAVIFVVDSADRLRVAVARDELWMILDHKDVIGRPVSFPEHHSLSSMLQVCLQIPILVLANKMDVKEAMTAAEISTSLGR